MVDSLIPVEVIEDFVQTDYDQKDSMHNLSHIKRTIDLAEKIASDLKYDPELLMLGAYFHGIIFTRGRLKIEFSSWD